MTNGVALSKFGYWGYSYILYKKKKSSIHIPSASKPYPFINNAHLYIVQSLMAHTYFRQKYKDGHEPIFINNHLIKYS